MVDVRDLWHESPSAEMVIRDGMLVAMNPAAEKLLGLTHADLESDAWEERVLGEKNRKKFRSFLSGQASVSSGLDAVSADGSVRHVRFLKRSIPSHGVLLSVQDITETREDAQAFQAGYDEFIRVTTDLEDALDTIEKQNRLLERQKQILQNELQVAHAVQAQILSQDFERHTLVKLGGAYQAMTELGGDMWEFFESEDSTWIVIADVMGHGVASSLISIAAKSIFKRRFEEASVSGMGVAAMVSAANRDLVEITHSNYFLTACVVRVDREYKMDFLTAGHPPILYIPADAKKPPQLLFTEQPMLGVFREIPYQSVPHRMYPGDRLLLYTDCLIESLNEQGESIDLEKIAERLRFRKDSTPTSVVQEMLEYRREFAGDRLPDDLTMVCLEVPGGRVAVEAR